MITTHIATKKLQEAAEFVSQLVRGAVLRGSSRRNEGVWYEKRYLGTNFVLNVVISY